MEEISVCNYFNIWDTLFSYPISVHYSFHEICCVKLNSYLTYSFLNLSPNFEIFYNLKTQNLIGLPVFVYFESDFSLK